MRPSPSSQTIDLFERTYGITIPEDLRDLLATANGGHPELDSVNGAEGEFAIDTFYHLTEDDRGTESLWYAMEHWRPILGDYALPFASDGGGNQFFLDLREGVNEVKICLHDQSMRVQVVANSFAELIDSLAIDPDFI